MALLFFEARAAQGYALVDEDIISDLGRFTHHDSHPVIDEQPAADLCARMNLYAGQKARQMADQSGDELEMMVPEPVRDSMEPDSVQSRVGQDDLEAGPRGRVAFKDSLDVLAHAAYESHARFLLDASGVAKLCSRSHRHAGSRHGPRAASRHCASRDGVGEASRYPCEAYTRLSQSGPASSLRPHCWKGPPYPSAVCRRSIQSARARARRFRRHCQAHAPCSRRAASLRGSDNTGSAPF